MDGLQKSVTNSCPLPSPHPGEDSTNLGNQSGGSHLIKGFHIKKKLTSPKEEKFLLENSPSNSAETSTLP